MKVWIVLSGSCSEMDDPEDSCVVFGVFWFEQDAKDYREKILRRWPSTLLWISEETVR